MRLVTTVLSTLLLAGAASGQLRVDYRSPVAGGRLEVLVDRATPLAEIVFAVSVDGGSQVPVDSRAADASGAVRFEVPLRDESAGKTWSLHVYEANANGRPTPTSVDVRIERPSLLLTGNVGGGASLLVEMPLAPGAAQPFLVESWRVLPLGRGRPGGAVRDGRCEKIFVIADADAGRVAVFDDDGAVPLEIALGADLRGIAATPDGRTILVASAGRNGENGRLHVLDAADPQPDSGIDLGFPLGKTGGKLVASGDSLRAFVTLDGAFLRDVDLLARRTGSKLLGVGAPGQDEIKDLRIVAGRLFALTGRSPEGSGPAAVTGFDVANPKHGGSERGSLQDSALLVGSRRGEPALFLLDGTFGELAVIDVTTFRKRASFAVPPGAEALLLTPDPSSTRGLLLYGARTPSCTARLVDLEREVVGDAVALGFPAHALAIAGASERIDLFFLGDGASSLVAYEPATGARSPLRLPFTLAAVSIGN